MVLAGLAEEGKLTRENYNTWKMKMQAVLVLKDLWAPVEDGYPSDNVARRTRRYTKQRTSKRGF